MEYKKSTDGNHFYRIGEKILHISHFREDDIFTQENEFMVTTAEVKKDDVCINVIEEIPTFKKTVDIYKEEFENELREAISILGIYGLTEVK